MMFPQHSKPSLFIVLVGRRRKLLFHRSLLFHGRCLLWLLFVATTCFSATSIATTSQEKQDNCPVVENINIRPDPKVIIDGKDITIEEPRFKKYHGPYPPSSPIMAEKTKDFSYFILNEEKPVLYVQNFLNESMAEELKQFCTSGGRFTQSPIGGYGDGNSRTVQKHDLRTSESCVLVPAVSYLANPRYQAMIQNDPLDHQTASIVREVDVSMDIAERASALVGVNSGTVEALQIVRYIHPDAHYQLHHDHGGYYGKDTEHRPWTMLIFLNDLAITAGGQTSFPKLGIDVVPKGGDALVWSNIQQSDREADPDMVHMGKPPSMEGIEKYAVNVWFGETTFAQRTMNGERGFGPT